MVTTGLVPRNAVPVRIPFGLPPNHQLIQSDRDQRSVKGATHSAGWHGGLPRIAGRKAGHGNDRAWKAWKAMMPASHPCMLRFEA
jgi:hypothetical protein